MKRILIALLIIALVVVLPSCKKKTSEDDSSTATAAVKASVSSSSAAAADNTTGSTSSFRTLEEPKSLTVAGESESAPSSGTFSFTPAPQETAEETETAEVAEPGEKTEETETVVSDEPLVDISSVEVEKPLVFVNETGTGDASFSLNEFYRGGELLIRASFTPTSGELVFNADETEVKKILKSLSVNYADYGEISYTLTGSLLEITYPGTTEEEVEAKWQNFKSFLNSYNEEKASLVEADDNELVVSKSAETVKGTLYASIYSDRAEITIPENMTNEETAAFIGWLLNVYPGAADYGTYTLSDGTLTLTYTNFSNRLAADNFEFLAKLADEYFAQSEETSAAAEAEKPAAATAADEKMSVEKKTAEEVGKKESFIKSYSVSACLTPSFNPQSSFNFGAGLRAEMNFSSWLGAGFSAGGNFTFGYFDALLYGRFTFAGFGKADIYGIAGVGADWSVRGGRAGLMLRAAVGVEYAVLDRLSVFGEIGYQYSALRKSDVYASVGVRYIF